MWEEMISVDIVTLVNIPGYKEHQVRVHSDLVAYVKDATESYYLREEWEDNTGNLEEGQIVRPFIYQWHKLESSEGKEPLLRKCLHDIQVEVNVFH